jgi:hypothetical protein
MRSTSIPALAVALVLAGCTAAHQQGRTKAALLDCGNLAATESPVALYAPDKITHVEPTYRTEYLARAIQPRRLVGANLYVAAQPGMTAAYAERVLSCHAAAGPGQTSDPLRVAGGADVSVSMRGPAMRIAVTGKTPEAAREIWTRARTLYEQPGDVTVDQLSAARGSSAF